MSGRWVVFDLIGVLAEPSWRDISKQGAARWDAFKRGELDEATFWDAAHAAAFREALRFRSGPRAYVERLKARKLKICLATNFSGEWLRHLLSKSATEALFDAKVVSSEVKAAKPDPEFFAEVLRHAPVGSIFVDDQEENCAAAARAGLVAIVARPGCDVEKEVEQLLRETR